MDWRMESNDFRPRAQRIEETEEQILTYIKRYIEKTIILRLSGISSGIAI